MAKLQIIANKVRLGDKCGNYHVSAVLFDSVMRLTIAWSAANGREIFRETVAATKVYTVERTQDESEQARFSVCIRKDGKLVQSWIQIVEWDSLDAFEQALIEKYPGKNVEIQEHEYF